VPGSSEKLLFQLLKLANEAHVDLEAGAGFRDELECLSIYGNNH